MGIILDFLKFGVIFGILSLTPLIIWLGWAVLSTDRRRSSSPS